MPRRVLRLSQVALISILALVALGASDSGARFDKDSHSLMCSCGCNELLGECNNMDCPDSPAMLSQLRAGIDKGESDNAIFHQFQQQYGPVVLAAPMFTRFNHMAWIMPPLVLFLGIAGTLLLVRKWKFRGLPVTTVPRTPADQDRHERVRRETAL